MNIMLNHASDAKVKTINILTICSCCYQVNLMDNKVTLLAVSTWVISVEV